MQVAWPQSPSSWRASGTGEKLSTGGVARLLGDLWRVTPTLGPGLHISNTAGRVQLGNPTLRFQVNFVNLPNFKGLDSAFLTTIERILAANLPKTYQMYHKGNPGCL